jgi:hypothetical protein
MPSPASNRKPFAFIRVHSRLTTCLLLAATAFAAPVNYSIVGDDPGPWPRILSSIGLQTGTPANLFVLRQGATADPAEWQKRVAAGALLVLEGPSPVAEAFGIQPAARKVEVQSLVDARAPKLEIVWQKELSLPACDLPADARIFARERWTSTPMLAGLKHGSGAVLWLAAAPGERGYERFPYLPQALADLGVDPGLRSRSLWAFFDSSYRLRVDLDYFAERWRKAGIGALHVAAWHYNEPDRDRDAWLERLIAACHKRAITVYAWFELPHVSERFWQDHPEWREQTAAGQDAHLDWRKLMNLQNTDCRNAVAASTRSLIERFDWDGVNLGELYFESLEGAANSARFTPYNTDVRRMFRDHFGIDPTPADPRFLAFRSALAQEMQRYWIGAVEQVRRERKPDLDLVLTHVDDRFDTRMRDLIGADVERTLPLLEDHEFTFLVEDPATVWHLGPERYPQIAARYAPLTRRPEKLAIDINVVERYQDVYPTKQQTGAEFFELVHLAARSFPRVALYFENSIDRNDLALLPAAAAVVDRYEQSGARTAVEAKQPVGIAWQGGALVDGGAWPFRSADTLWLPAGVHVVEPSAKETPLRIRDFNGELKSASATAGAVEFSYESTSRALAVLHGSPSGLEVDGEPRDLALLPGNVLALPRGQHLVRLRY